MSLQRVRPERSISCTRPAGTEERNNTNSTWALASGLTSLVRIEISSSLGIRSGDRGELLSRPGEVEQYTRGVDLNAYPESRPPQATTASLPVSPHSRPRIRRRRNLRRHGGGTLQSTDNSRTEFLWQLIQSQGTSIIQHPKPFANRRTESSQRKHQDHAGR
jgi:hypothetical protein